MGYKYINNTSNQNIKLVFYVRFGKEYNNLTNHFVEKIIKKNQLVKVDYGYGNNIYLNGFSLSVLGSAYNATAVVDVINDHKLDEILNNNNTISLSGLLGMEIDFYNTDN